ncbi:hypothetical protein OGM63_07110 [Plectonema radiosum NIES-515]|uniref:Uncharacterized protein n=1 Tax=Plectonema radiosum NIES-515 TaxID=2986073 RepID=A0ABT3AXD8_9CYAN|nr:hypothetical protein [Plectonema radiosum]MCV3213294.1 hypothetical protein [Plectonema radiosum NIES-515]
MGSCHRQITTGRLIRTIHTDNREGDTDPGDPDLVLFSPDGELLAIAATRNITLWQVSSGEKIHTIDRVHQGWGRCMAFSPNGQTLAFTADQIPRGVQAPKFIYGGKPQAISIAVKFRFDFEYTF